MADEERSEERVTLDIALLRAELRDALREMLPELVPSPPPGSLDPDELAAALLRKLSLHNEPCARIDQFESERSRALAQTSKDS